MARVAGAPLAVTVAAGLCLALVLGGCVIRPTTPTSTPQPVYVSRPAPVYASQPVVVQPAPVVVQPAPVVVSRPPVVVYRAAPSPVRTPARVYAPGVPVRGYSWPSYSPYPAYGYPAYGYPCTPGTARACEAYYGPGYQICTADGGGWGGCFEGGFRY